MPDWSVTTVVRDAGRLGGGMAEVATNIHAGLSAVSTGNIFACVVPPENAVVNQEIAGPTARRFNGAGVGFGSVVHVHGIWTAFEWHACRVARAKEARLVISPHGALEPWAMNHKWLKKRLAWWSYQRSTLQNADLLIVNSAQELAHLRDLGLKAPIGVIANGVNISSGDFDVCLERKKIILFLSRLTPKKGVPDLLDAWHAIAERRGYVLHIHGYGEPEYEAFLRQRILELREENSVKLLPAVFEGEKWATYGGASLYVLPSYSENFGITVAEALLCGLPVITTRATPWSDIEAEGLGWIIDNDVTQLGDALRSAIQMPADELCGIGRRAARFARAKFLWPDIVERYIATYAWISNSDLPQPDWVDGTR